MPIGRGLMQFIKVGIHPTVTSFSDIDPEAPFAHTSDTITFSITVATTDGGPAPSDGYVHIIDVNSFSVLASNVVTSGNCSIITTLASGNYLITAYYEGVMDSYLSSISSQVSYPVTDGKP